MFLKISLAIVLMIFISCSSDDITSDDNLTSNPSACYCENIMEGEYNTDNSTCTLPNGNTYDAWGYYRGIEGSEDSYCEKYGYKIVPDTVFTDGYSTIEPFCVKCDSLGNETERIAMSKLMFENGDRDCMDID